MDEQTTAQAQVAPAPVVAQAPVAPAQVAPAQVAPAPVVAQANPFEGRDDFTKASSGNFVSWDVIGQAVEGVLIDTYLADNYNKDGKEMVYILRLADGSQVQLNARNEGFARTMRQKVSIGQMVGFYYSKDVDTGKGNPAKSIEIYPGRIVDEAMPESDNKTENAVGQM